MVILVTSDSRFPGWEGLAAELQVRIPNLVSVVQMVNPRPVGPVLNGRRNQVAGRPYLVERLGDLTFHLSPESFLQVNPAQTLPLYDQVRDFAALTGAEDLLDVYCGIGTISLYLARSARHVTGIEVVPAAVEDAAATAKLNGLANTSFQAGPAERLLPNLARRGYRPEVVIVDPPRAGVAPEALAALASLHPRRIVYVSCDPETLARDLRRLANSGYRTQAIQPVDMFPQTSHTEAVAVVVRE
jgi:23S rRNA (uracil1939-C5)-methyltransferase